MAEFYIAFHKRTCRNVIAFLSKQDRNTNDYLLIDMKNLLEEVWIQLAYQIRVLEF